MIPIKLFVKFLVIATLLLGAIIGITVYLCKLYIQFQTEILIIGIMAVWITVPILTLLYFHKVKYYIDSLPNHEVS